MEDWETTAVEDLAEAETAVAATDWVAADLVMAEVDSVAVEMDLAVVEMDLAVVETASVVHSEEDLAERSARLVSCIWHTKLSIRSDSYRESLSNKYTAWTLSKCIHQGSNCFLTFL